MNIRDYIDDKYIELISFLLVEDDPCHLFDEFMAPLSSLVAVSARFQRDVSLLKSLTCIFFGPAPSWAHAPLVADCILGSTWVTLAVSCSARQRDQQLISVAPRRRQASALCAN